MDPHFENQLKIVDHPGILVLNTLAHWDAVNAMGSVKKRIKKTSKMADKFTVY